jgi:hypothetical protein
LFKSGLSVIVKSGDTVRRKIQPKPESVVPAEILELAKNSISPDKVKKVRACSVCGGESAGVGEEALCWVCRRLKVSAWRESEQQMPAQE